jgi:hypothetical protein
VRGYNEMVTPSSAVCSVFQEKAGLINRYGQRVRGQSVASVAMVQPCHDMFGTLCIGVYARERGGCTRARGLHESEGAARERGGCTRASGLRF